MRFWKIAQSQTGDWFPDEEYRIAYRERLLVVGGADDEQDLWRNFINEVQPGDFFYATRNGIVKFCGFISSYIMPEDSSPMSGNSKKGYYLLKDSIEYDKNKFRKILKQKLNASGSSKKYLGWMPPHQYRLQEIPETDLELFESTILKTCFELSLQDVFAAAKENQMKEILESMKVVLALTGQIILNGPPGTGKTYRAKQLAVYICDEKVLQGNDLKLAFGKLQEKCCVAIVQFHPSYNYEDFVRGVQVATEAGKPRYTTTNRVMAEMAEDASKSNKPFVLIIDEINRANLASVMGELIYALEYRGESVRTPYALEDRSYGLKIPDNLYIIGTMNTADRSIGNIDYAVRRRFAFVPCLPDRDILSDFPVGQKLFDAVSELFQKGEKRCLSPDFYSDDVQPGHTYFMVKEHKIDDKVAELARKFAYQVYPLLREYYKDGILVKKDKPKDLLLALPDIESIQLDQPQPASKIYEIIKSWAEQELKARKMKANLRGMPVNDANLK